MSNRLIKIHNPESGEIIEREMTKEEILQFEQAQLEYKKDQEKQLEIKKLRHSALIKLGLTEDEIAVL